MRAAPAVSLPENGRLVCRCLKRQKPTSAFRDEQRRTKQKLDDAFCATRPTKMPCSAAGKRRWLKALANKQKHWEPNFENVFCRRNIALQAGFCGQRSSRYSSRKTLARKNGPVHRARPSALGEALSEDPDSSNSAV
jgi:hypothetical protein